MQVLVAVISHNRPEIFKLASLFLLRGKHPDILVVDDSTDSEKRDYLRKLKAAGFVTHLKFYPPSDPQTWEEAHFACGLQRQRAVQFFLEHIEYRWLFLLDDDIVVPSRSIYQALDDFLYLRGRGANPGTMCLHSWCKVEPIPPEKDKRQFARVGITGESVLLTERSVLETTGNLFGPSLTGQCDEFWRVLREKGFCKFTRIDPPYEVVHLGVSDATEIYRAGWDHGIVNPFWVRDFWRTHLAPERYMQVRGFDFSRFIQYLRRSGKAKTAAAMYYRNLVQTMTRERNSMANLPEEYDKGDIDIPQENEEVSANLHREATCEDKIPGPSGSLEIRIRKPGGDVLETRTISNVVVNNTRTQLAYLLGGTYTNRTITQISFGTGTTAEDATDSALESAVVTKDISSYTFPTTQSVRIVGLLDTDEGNGNAITEVGLLFGNTTLATRKVFAAINKTSDFQIEIVWTLTW